jgi:hypothetical protein
MRKLILAVPVVAALAALAVPSLASAATSNTVCQGGYYGGPITSGPVNGNLVVPAGQTCRFAGTINGNATVSGYLQMFGGEVTGNVNIEPGGAFHGINSGVTIDKNLNITDPAGNDAAFFGDNGAGTGFWGPGNEVKGNINYTITPTGLAAYSQYNWPYLYGGGGVTVDKNVNYSIGATPNRAWVDALGNGAHLGFNVLGQVVLS